MILKTFAFVFVSVVMAIVHLAKWLAIEHWTVEITNVSANVIVELVIRARRKSMWHVRVHKHR